MRCRGARFLLLPAVLLHGAGDPKLDLMRAAEAGDAQEVGRLLSQGADVNSRNKVDSSALYGRREVVTLLLDRGANVNARDNRGGTPLAAFLDDPGLAERMIAKGADAHAKDKGGKPPLDLAVAAGHTQVAELLGRLAP